MTPATETTNEPKTQQLGSLILNTQVLQHAEAMHACVPPRSLEAAGGCARGGPPPRAAPACTCTRVGPPPCFACVQPFLLLPRVHHLAASQHLCCPRIGQRAGVCCHAICRPFVLALPPPRAPLPPVASRAPLSLGGPCARTRAHRPDSASLLCSHQGGSATFMATWCSFRGGPCSARHALRRSIRGATCSVPLEQASSAGSANANRPTRVDTAAIRAMIMAIPTALHSGTHERVAARRPGTAHKMANDAAARTWQFFSPPAPRRPPRCPARARTYIGLWPTRDSLHCSSTCQGCFHIMP